MAFLAVVVLAAASLVACYQPTLRDCTISCTSASDCAGDQVCGASGWCAAPGVACSLEADAADDDAAITDARDIDAATIDARTIDAASIDATIDAASIDAASIDATIDAPTDAASDAPIDAAADLRIVISGRGSVAGNYPGIDCQSPPGDCTYGISPGTVVMLTAVDGPGGSNFVDWTTPNCQGAGRTCTVTINAPVTLVGAEFN